MSIYFMKKGLLTYFQSVKNPAGRRVDTKKTDLLFKGSLYIYKSKIRICASVNAIGVTIS